jgi:hypothetical protein
MPRRVEHLSVVSLSVLAHCSDGSLRLVGMPVKKGPSLLNYLKHRICGGTLLLSERTYNTAD